MEIRVADLTEEALKGIGHMMTPRTWTPPRPADEHSYVDTTDDLGLPAPCSSGVVECAPRARVIRRMGRHVRTPEALVCLALLAWSPLAGGWLTAMYRKGQAADPQSRVGAGNGGTINPSRGRASSPGT